MTPPNSPHHAVIDASALVGFCAAEPGKYPKVLLALQQYNARGFLLHAPSLIVMETVFALCRKLQDSLLTPTEHALAVANLQNILPSILPPPRGDASLIIRAEQLRSGLGCSRSADAFYIALAEELAQTGPTELLTFDVGQHTLAKALAPTITVQLLQA